MTFFDLIFLGLLVWVVGALGFAAVAAARRRPAVALGTLRVLGAVLLVYVATVTVVAVCSPQRVFAVGEPRCFDDWCISVTGVRHGSAGTYTVDFLISSRMRRGPQRERDIVATLIDQDGRTYQARTDANDVPFDTRLDPGQSQAIERTFLISGDARPVALTITHSGIRPELLIIASDESAFHKRAIVRF
ncbi:MAG: hypothetical protein WCE44_16645 [Candidatus Velthaea sp.]|jgi:hypothetical protein